MVRVEKEEKILVCEFSSWYHLLGIFSFLRFLNKKFRKLVFIHNGFKGVKINFPFFIFDIYSEEVIHCKHGDIRKEIEKKDKVVFLTQNKFSIKFPMLAILGGFSIKTTLIEEGIGSYGGWKEHFRALVREKILSESGVVRKTTGAFNVLTKIPVVLFSFMLKKNNWYIFDEKGNAKREVVEAYKSALNDLLKFYDIPEFNNNESVFISSPFAELGLIDEAEYVSNVTKIVNGKREGFLIKPHPIERLHKFDGMRIVEDIPFELILAKNKNNNINVYCFGSTVLYTSNIFSEVKPFWVKGYDCFYGLFSSLQKKIMYENSLIYGEENDKK